MHGERSGGMFQEDGISSFICRNNRGEKAGTKRRREEESREGTDEGRENMNRLHYESKCCYT